MFTYNRGCVENFADEKKIEKFENTAIGQWINEMKENIEKAPLKSGGTYEPSIEKLEENSDFENGKLELKDLYNIAKDSNEISLESGKQELFENIINQYI